jgi:RNA polymerase sigma-70 factor (ECF subfamily)
VPDRPRPHPPDSENIAEPPPFEALVRTILTPAYGLALHLTRNSADAEDLVQEAALLAFRHYASFTRDSNFRAWFFTILVNAFRARYRKEQRRPMTIAFDDLPDLFLYSRTAELGMHEQYDDPAAALMSRLDTAEVTTAIEALPDEYRMVTALYFVQDLSYQEIADVLECPVGTVRSRLHRGRKMLQKALWHVAQQRGIVR